MTIPRRNPGVESKAVKKRIGQWLHAHQPLPRAEFDDIQRQFISSVGDAAEHLGYGRNTRVRRTDAEVVGAFAAQTDVALLEVDESVTHAELFGVDVDGGYVPLLVTMHGDVETVAQRMHGMFHLLETARSCTCRRVVPDGGKVI